MIIHNLFQRRPELLRLKQVADTQPTAGHLILISRTDTTTGGANFLITTDGLANLVQGNMVRQDQRTTRADHQSIANLDAGCFEHLQLFKQRRDGQNHTITDQALDLGVQDT